VQRHVDAAISTRVSGWRWQRGRGANGVKGDALDVAIRRRGALNPSWLRSQISRNKIDLWEA
jgi:hypothetical protein